MYNPIASMRDRILRSTQERVSARIPMCEVFPSKCGEGMEVGIPAVFVRTSGCGVGCAYCDTAYAFSGGQNLSIPEIMHAILNAERVGTERGVILDGQMRRVFITGGEPLVAKHIDLLIQDLMREGFRIMLQTSGWLYRPEVFELVDYLSVDVKGPSARLKDDILSQCMGSVERIYREFLVAKNRNIQFKFNIADEIDYDFFRAWTSSHPLAPVYVQPVAPVTPDILSSGYSDKYHWLLDKLCARDPALAVKRRNPLVSICSGVNVERPIGIQVGYQTHKVNAVLGEEEYQTTGGVRF